MKNSVGSGDNVPSSANLNAAAFQEIEKRNDTSKDPNAASVTQIQEM